MDILLSKSFIVEPFLFNPIDLVVAASMTNSCPFSFILTICSPPSTSPPFSNPFKTVAIPFAAKDSNNALLNAFSSPAALNEASDSRNTLAINIPSSIWACFLSSCCLSSLCLASLARSSANIFSPPSLAILSCSFTDSSVRLISASNILFFSSLAFLNSSIAI